ncbi:MAG: hypothetical protein WBZ36_29995, partial [Candidatus Nitrosopolaris sp.]
ALPDALEEVIDGGSRVIQRRILHLLYSRIGLELPFAMTTNFEVSHIGTTTTLQTITFGTKSSKQEAGPRKKKYRLINSFELLIL